MRSQLKNYIIKMAYLKMARKCRHCSSFWKYGIVLILILTSALVFLIRNKKNSDKILSNSESCEVTSEQKVHLFNLLKQVIAILNKLDVIYFLCYTSLWGAVQESGPLPWDRNADLCVLNTNLVTYDEASIHRIFQRQNLSLQYRSSEGEYIIKNANSNGENSHVKLTVFEADGRLNRMYRRVGWKRRLLPPDCDAHPDLQCFPAHLVGTPLPVKTFGPLSIPGPTEDMDFLKIQYPDTWWKPIKPICHN